MKAYKLWLEQDPDIPEFRRLRFEEIEVPVQDILRRGIHPASMLIDNRRREGSKLNERITDILNGSEMKIAGLAEFGYCEDISEHRSFYRERDDFESNARKIAECICFMDKLDYATLLSIARRRFIETWSHETALKLAQRVYPDFNDLRAFLKGKDKTLKLSGYNDLGSYRLDKVLRLEDFEGQDKAIIACGIQTTNFRNAKFLDLITTAEGCLCLTEGFDWFSIIETERKGEYDIELTWRCRRKGEEVYFMPDIEYDDRKRDMARRFADTWGGGTGSYCFTVSLDTVARMIKKPNISISFEGYSYKGESSVHVPDVKAKGPRVERYTTGRYLTIKSTNQEIQEALKNHGVSMTGKKDKLAEKLAQLSVRLYREQVENLNDFFKTRKFIKVPRLDKDKEKTFPVLQELDIGSMLRAMYVLRHSRGKVIIDATHENNTYELIDLARALVNGKVNIDGVFVRVENQDNEFKGGEQDGTTG